MLQLMKSFFAVAVGLDVA